ncbi:NAD-dependent succinate-semialdehyde dehydrogenase [Enterococcus sp. DIV0876]|uniref:NAD-dependent succinate-semialdehyde dehydrogenase n=1 Tax=Enterococcus sp. DIV0876 TaxID=2774633 RepID=UPI003D2FB5A8
MNRQLPEVPTKLLIDGKWVDGSQEAVAVIDPATNEELVKVSQGSTQETKDAIAAAAKAFTSWSRLSPKERADHMNNIADLMAEETDRLALIMSLEQGKPLKEAAAEIQSNIDNFRWNASEAQRVYGEVIPAPEENHWLVRKEAIGVVGAITPWNFPSNMIARKIAPAIAVGCTLVMKPSKETPLSALALGDIFQRAGLPAGVVNILLGSSSDIGKELTENETVKKITFTGSTKVGMKLYEQAAPTLKKVSLELGGHAPFIVFSDADLTLAVEKLIAAKFRNNGQVCTSPNRIFVEESIKEEFTERLLEKMPDVTVGLGTDDPTVGPLINQAGVDKVVEQLADATDKGAKILYGGHKLTEDFYQKGNFFEPTVIDGVTPDMNMYYEETFGPVIPLISFKDREAVVEAANDTVFGLASYFFSTNLQTISNTAQKLQYGMVGVNDIAISNPAAPFGGVKHSGFGRENGKYGPEEYVTVKFIAIDAQ